MNKTHKEAIAGAAEISVLEAARDPYNKERILDHIEILQQDYRDSITYKIPFAGSKIDFLNNVAETLGFYTRYSEDGAPITALAHAYALAVLDEVGYGNDLDKLAKDEDWLAKEMIAQDPKWQPNHQRNGITNDLDADAYANISPKTHFGNTKEQEKEKDPRLSRLLH